MTRPSLDQLLRDLRDAGVPEANARRLVRELRDHEDDARQAGRDASGRIDTDAILQTYLSVVPRPGILDRYPLRTAYVVSTAGVALLALLLGTIGGILMLEGSRDPFRWDYLGCRELSRILSISIVASILAIGSLLRSQRLLSTRVVVLSTMAAALALALGCVRLSRIDDGPIMLSLSLPALWIPIGAALLVYTIVNSIRSVRRSWCEGGDSNPRSITTR